MNNRDDLLNEYGVKNFEEMAEVEQDASAVQALEGKTPVVLGDSTFYVKISEKWVGQLGLLTQESLSPAERAKLSELLRILKLRTAVRNAAGKDCRREFLSALREREAIAANLIRQEEQKARQ